MLISSISFGKKYYFYFFLLSATFLPHLFNGKWIGVTRAAKMAINLFSEEKFEKNCTTITWTTCFLWASINVRRFLASNAACFSGGTVTFYKDGSRDFTFCAHIKKLSSGYWWPRFTCSLNCWLLNRWFIAKTVLENSSSKNGVFWIKKMKNQFTTHFRDTNENEKHKFYTLDNEKKNPEVLKLLSVIRKTL